MNMNVTRIIITLMAACAICTTLNAQTPTTMPADHGGGNAAHGQMPSPVSQSLEDVAAFAEALDYETLGLLAVQSNGRIKSFESFASSYMQSVTGAQRINGQRSSFTFLDLLFREQAYTSRPIVYVKKKPMRAQIIAAVRRDSVAPTRFVDLESRLDYLEETGLIDRTMLGLPAVRAELSRLGANLVSTGKHVQAIENAVALADPVILMRSLTVIPIREGDFHTPWLSIADVGAAMEGGGPLTSDDSRLIAASWLDLGRAWQQLDADAANVAIAGMVQLTRGMNESVYPQEKRLEWESWYFRSLNMVWVWIIYALAAIPLVCGAVFKWNKARWGGLALFAVAFGFHSFAIWLRWYVSGRWPNSNMFEAVTTAAWFGGVGALFFEIFLHRSPLRGLFALCSAVASMVALMCAHFMPLSLNANISNMMPVLHDVWLYIHTNVIIFSYCLIFMAAVTASLYVFYRAALRIQGKTGNTDEYARVGGAASLIQIAPDGSTMLAQPKTTLGQVLDGTTMVLMELAFITLWAGLVMGAIWADHSWGRPWGWDPKETFALNTFVVFALLIHVRLKVKDKGLWTAVLAVIGAAVMLFNWIVINFFISGLHSYA